MSESHETRPRDSLDSGGRELALARDSEPATARPLPDLDGDNANGNGTLGADLPAPPADEEEQRPAETRSAVVRVGDAISSALAGIQITVLLASGVVIIWEVTSRYFLRKDFTASTDILTFLFGWLVFLGLPRALWRDSSPKLGLGRSYPKRVSDVLPALGIGATWAYFGLQFWSYIELFPSQQNTLLPTLGIPFYYATLAIPITNVLCMLLLTQRLIARGKLLRNVAAGIVGVAFVAVLASLHMTPQVAALIAVVVLLAVDCPIAVALGVAGEVMIINGAFGGIAAAASELADPMSNIALLAVPLFMLMGTLFANSRLARDLSVFIRSLVGWLPGGMGVGSVVTAAVFANVSGSAIADTAAIGNVYIPEMLKAGYKREQAAAVQAAAGVIGVIFPPAVAMILFASVANISVTPVFEAVVVPGLMIALGMAIVAIWAGRRNRLTVGEFQAGNLWKSLPRVLPVLAVPFILDGGIFSGIFTPSESGAVAIVFSAIVIFAMRSISWPNLRAALVQAVDGTTMVMFILTAVSMLNYGFLTSGLAQQVQSVVGLGGHSVLLTLLIINLIFIIAHLFMETAPAILVLVPIVLPSAVALGVSPLQLAVIVGVNSTIGQIMPPVGVSLYVSSQIAKIEARSVVRSIIPYVVASTVILALVTVIPQFSLWLPGWLG